MKKDFFKEPPNLEKLGELICNPEKRFKWDQGVNKYAQLEGSDKDLLVHIWMKSPIVFIQERDSVEKVFSFVYNDQFYSLLTSVNDDIIPIPDKVIRLTDFLSLHCLYMDDEYVYFKNMGQCDVKTVIPQNLVNITLPLKLNAWYKKICEVYNEEYGKKEEKKENNETLNVNSNYDSNQPMSVKSPVSP